MMRKLACAAFLLLLGTCNASYGFGVCEAKVLRDVAVAGHPETSLKRGETIGSITSYTFDGEDPSIAEFCSKGGYCYSSKIIIGDKAVDAMKLTNCKVFKRGRDYQLEPIRGKIPYQDLRRYYIDEKLGSVGMCSACAGNMREEYITHPDSSCAIQVREALEGFPDAIRALKMDENACSASIGGDVVAVTTPAPSQALKPALPVMSVEQMNGQPAAVRLMAMAIFVRMECSAYELTDGHFSVLKNTLYPNGQTSSSADNEKVGQMVAYFTINKEVACPAAWNTFGSSGSIVPGLIAMR